MLPTPPQALSVAVPTGGDPVQQSWDQPVLAALRRAVPEVTQAVQGRFSADLWEVAQPPPGHGTARDCGR